MSENHCHNTNNPVKLTICNNVSETFSNNCASINDDLYMHVDHRNSIHWIITEIGNLQIPSPSCNFLHLNIRSIVSHLDELESIIDLLETPTFIGVAETWLKNHNHELYSLNNYFHHAKCRSTRNGGGVSIFVHHSIPTHVTEYPSTLLLNSAESIFVETDGKPRGSNRKYLIGEIYRPPNLPTEPFIEEFNKLLEYCNTLDHIVYIMGDFNIDLLKYPNGKSSRDFLNTVINFSFIPLLNCPTRVTNRSSSLIDCIFTNDPEALTNSKTHLILNQIADHYPILHSKFLGLASDPPANQTKDHNGNYILNEASLARLHNSLQPINWDNHLTSTDPNLAFEQFFIIIIIPSFI